MQPPDFDPHNRRHIVNTRRVDLAYQTSFLFIALTMAAPNATAGGNQVPNPSFETGQNLDCSTQSSGLDCTGEFDKHIDSWKVARPKPNAPCWQASVSPDWIDLPTCPNGAGCPPNTSNRVVALSRNGQQGTPDSVRVGLVSALAADTYQVSVRMALNTSLVASGATLRLHLTHWGEHWNSDKNDNIRIFDFANFTIGAGQPHQWYTFSTILAVPQNLDGDLANLVLQYHENSAPGHIYLDDVSIVPCGSATVTQQPSDQVLQFGQDATFSIQVSGTGITSYQWQRLDPTPVDLQNGSDYLGTDTAVLTIKNANYLDVGTYRCRVTYNCGEVSSSSASLDCVDAPFIVHQPVDVSVALGSPATFTVTVPTVVFQGSEYSYHWYKDTAGIALSDGGSISGSSTNTLHINPTVLGDAGLYHCQIDNICGTTHSRQIRLHFVGTCYFWDDGSTETSVGTNSPADDILWMHRQGEAGIVTVVDSISTAWGSVPFGGGPPNGTPARFGLWAADAAGTGDPTNAVLLVEVSATVVFTNTDRMQTVQLIPPVTVVGKYFIGASCRGGTYPAPLDQSSGPSLGRAWIAAQLGGPISYTNLAVASIPPADIDTGAPGVWLLRAGCSQ